MRWLRNFLLTCGLVAGIPAAVTAQSPPGYTLPSGPVMTVPVQPGLPTTPPIIIGSAPGVPVGTVIGPAHALPAMPPASLGAPVWDAGPVTYMDPGSDAFGSGPERLWADVDYLYWFVSGNPTPALITTGPASQTPAEAGVLTAAGTQVVYGNEWLNAAFQSGVRLRAGYWFDPQRQYGFSGSFSYFIPDEADFSVGANSGSPVISRPYVDAQTNQHAAQLVRYPGILEGGVTGTSRTSLLAGDLNMLFNLFHCENEQAAWEPSPGYPQPPGLVTSQRLDFSMGYRYFRLSDEMNLGQSLVFLDQGVPTGTTLLANDRFYTRNDYHAINLGLNYRWQRDRWAIDLRPGLGFGWLKGETDISGFTATTTPPAAPVFTEGGLLALPSNIGNFRNQRFVWMPQFEAGIGYQVTDHLLIRLGGNVMYFGKVLRAGDQIDSRINATQLRGGVLLGEPVPAYPLNFTSLTIAGLTAGVEFRY